MERRYWSGHGRAAATPLMLPDKGPATAGEQIALQLPTAAVHIPSRPRPTRPRPTDGEK